MASTYSSTLNLEIQATGENSGTWGTITNNNLQKLESAIKALQEAQTRIETLETKVAALEG